MSREFPKICDTLFIDMVARCPAGLLLLAMLVSVECAAPPARLQLTRRALIAATPAVCLGTGASSCRAEVDARFTPRGGLQAKWLEQLRIVLQDQADDLQYGGELAPGGPPSAIPSLLLVPIVQMDATLAKLEPLLSDESKWDAMLSVLTTGPFATTEFKRIFNAYSDNIYYASGSSEANAYMLGGATPSTAQTTQYLLRNEALRQLGELKDEIVYQKGLPVAKRENDVMEESLYACRKAFADYFKLASPEELKLARTAVYGEGKDAPPNKLARSG